MYRVLLPVDNSETRALSQAEYVTSLPSAANDVEAIILHVFTGDGDGSDSRNVARVASVKRAREYLRDHDVEVTLVEDSLEAADSIVKHANSFDADAVVMGGRKRSPAGKALFGSVTQSVFLHTDRPVVVTGDRRE